MKIDESTEMWCVFYSIAMAIQTFKYGGGNADVMDRDSRTIADRMTKTVGDKLKKNGKKEKIP